jgi:hypothetical protein
VRESKAPKGVRRNDEETEPSGQATSRAAGAKRPNEIHALGLCKSMDADGHAGTRNDLETVADISHGAGDREMPDERYFDTELS